MVIGWLRRPVIICSNCLICVIYVKRCKCFVATKRRPAPYRGIQYMRVSSAQAAPMAPYSSGMWGELRENTDFKLIKLIFSSVVPIRRLAVWRPLTTVLSGHWLGILWAIYFAQALMITRSSSGHEIAPVI